MLFFCSSTIIAASIKTRDFVCSSNAGKISLVLIGGELGTQVRDEASSKAAVYDNQNENYLSVTLFAYSLYQVRIYLDCSQEYGSHALDTNCKRAHHVNVWIDLNDDGVFDASENQIYHQSPINAETPGDIYNLQIFTPMFDDTKIKAGIHRMRISVTRSEAYQKQCGSTNYVETREYMANIIRRKVCRGKILILIFNVLVKNRK